MTAADALIVAEPVGRYVPQTTLVVDCSVVAAYVFQEPERLVAGELMAGHELSAPNLLSHEMVSVAVKKAGGGLKDVAIQGLADFSEMPIGSYCVNSAAQWRLALQYKLSAYDAAYLWLAAELNAYLATFDRSLGEAAKRHLQGQ